MLPCCDIDGAKVVMSDMGSATTMLDDERMNLAGGLCLMVGYKWDDGGGVKLRKSARQNGRLPTKYRTTSYP